MRAIAHSDALSLKAYAGTTGVILAFDILPARRAGLLGFAIQRSGGNRPAKCLAGGLAFPGVRRKPGECPASIAGPFQGFRWADYTVFAARPYPYSARPV